jgi:hypothetical protein
MTSVLIVELLKLRRSLALVLALVAPGLIALFLSLSALRDEGPRAWDVWLMQGSGIWAFFMLPMSVTALTALMAHMEHGPQSWSHLRALPVPRWRLYAAKAIAALALVALMSAAALILPWAALELAARLKPAIAPTGEIAVWSHALRMSQVFAAGVLLVAVQLWTALRFHSFVPGLTLGIGGTFFATVATSAKEGVFLPWQMPVNVFASDPARAQLALTLGGLGGLVVLTLAIAHLARRDPI